MRQPIFRIVLVTALAAAALLGVLIGNPSRTEAGSISAAIIGMFPKSTDEFAYADLKSARKLPWFAQIQDQMLPKQMRDFETFLSSAGIDPNADLGCGLRSPLVSLHSSCSEGNATTGCGLRSHLVSLH